MRRTVGMVLLIVCVQNANGQTVPAPSPAEQPSQSQGASEDRQYETDERVKDDRQDPIGLRLEDLEQSALRHNPTLASARARMDAARGRHMQAGRYPNPVAGYHATEIGNRGTSGQQGGFVSQRFITGGKLRLDQLIAAKEIDETHFRFHAQEFRVLTDVRVRFYDALVAQRRVKLTGQLARIGDELVSVATRLHEGRLGAENDVLQAEIRADESHILSDNAANQKEEAWRRLAAVVGQPTLPMSPLHGDIAADLPTLRWDECYAAALIANPTRLAAQARVERAVAAVQRARQQPVPNIELAVSVRHNNVTGSDNANVQVGLPLPVFDRNRGGISAAEAEWIIANKNVERIELQLQDRLAVEWRRFANARSQVDRYRTRMLPRARRSLELVRAGYEKGQLEYLNLLNAQQTFVRVNLSYLESLRQLRAAAARLEGKLLSDSLKTKPL